MDVPAGAGLSYNIIGVHRDENIYPDTLKFSPERFVDPNNSPSASEWIPFGGGPRICLGTWTLNICPIIYQPLLPNT